MLHTLIALLISTNAFASTLYVPAKFDSRTARVIVVIHGCMQTADTMMRGTGFNQIADEENLLVIYPQVPTGSNPLNCWGWYLPENQVADSGQLHTIMQEIADAKKANNVANANTYVAGLSSGAATAAGLLACFPKAFTAGAIHSGPSYATATSQAEAEKVLRDGPPANIPEAPCNPKNFTGKIIAIQGTADTVVNPKHALRVITDFSTITSPETPQSREANGLQYTTTDYKLKGKLKARLIEVTGLAHLWSGANLNQRTMLPLPPFFADKGPSASNEIWDFFASVR